MIVLPEECDEMVGRSSAVDEAECNRREAGVVDEGEEAVGGGGGVGDECCG